MVAAEDLAEVFGDSEDISGVELSQSDEEGVDREASCSKVGRQVAIAADEDDVTSRLVKKRRL